MYTIFTTRITYIQICHASVGPWWNVSQREDGFPEGGVRGKTIVPRVDSPSGYPHWHGIFVLLHRTNTNLVKYQWKQQWLPVDPVRTVDVLPVNISPVDMMEWPTFVSQSRLTIFTWGIIILVVPHWPYLTPAKMVAYAVTRYVDEFDIPFFEFWYQFYDTSCLSATNWRIVSWMRKYDAPSG